MGEIDMMEQQTPTLVFGEVEDAVKDKQPLAEIPQAKEVKEELDDSVLSEEERRQVDEFAKQIDLHNSTAILQYGVGTQKKMADFSGNALENVKTKDLGEVGEMLSDVVTQLKGFDEEEEKGFLGLFKKPAHKLESMKAKYAKAETNVNKICEALESNQVQLLKDIALLDKMYDLNLTYFKELSMYILAGKGDGTAAASGEGEGKRLAGGRAGGERPGSALRPLREKDSRSGADKNGVYPDSAADQAGAEQRYHDGGKDSVHDCKHHSSLEEPDGPCPWRYPCGTGGQGPEGSVRYDQ